MMKYEVLYEKKNAAGVILDGELSQYKCLDGMLLYLEKSNMFNDSIHQDALLVLDMKRVSYINARGISCLISMRSRLARKGRIINIRLIFLRREIYHVMLKLQLNWVFDISVK